MRLLYIGVTDGMVVSKDQEVQVQYLGNIHWFQVTSLKPLTTSHHDSLLIDMSNMSLDVDCSTDSVEVDGAMVDTKNDVAHMTAVCSTNCNFFVVTLQSHMIIQTCSSNLVSCSNSNYIDYYYCVNLPA